jgi:acyl-CoA synthetase (NDP forming)/GNAT superfamily N-acetyltransferase
MATAQQVKPQDEVTTTRLLAPFTRDVLLATGRAVRIRPARIDDVESLRRFYDELSETSSYYRFFGARRFVPVDELRAAAEQDVGDRVTLLVETHGELIAVGEYHATPGGDDAEVAFAVADAHHREGIATVLLEDLASIAREAGFRRLTAHMLSGNVDMRNVFRDVGLVYRSWFEDGITHVDVDLTADDLVQDHADLRDWRSAVRSLRPILDPGHVVVIGAGRNATSPGRRILDHLVDSFDGMVSVVHPSVSQVGGVPAKPAIADLDGIPDLAVVAVPAAAVADVVEQCGAAGVGSAVVVSAGFAETGTAGAALEEQVLAAARRHGMRLVGPNCLGVVSTSCGLNTTFTSQRFLPGGIAIASQSGGVGIAIAAEAERRAAGISSFVSMGNKADVSGNDLLRLWADDDATRVMLLYLESIGDPVRFARVATAVSQRKPVVALKGGKSTPGIRGARSHTAALAGDSDVVSALFAHTGVIRARTMEEFIDVGLLLDRQPTPRGLRVALVGNAGGPLVLGADAADENGAAVPEFSPSLQDSLTRLLPTAASCANPVDLGASASPRQLADAVRRVAASGEVDACVVVCVEMNDTHIDETIALLDAAADDGVPVAVSVIASRERAAGRLPMFPNAERAATAMALAAGRAEWLSRQASESTDNGPVDAAAIAAARRAARRQLTGEATTWLGQDAALRLIDTAGIEVVPWSFARSAEECATAVRALGPPCVIKADVTGLLHKTEEGVVQFGFANVDAAAAAYRTFQQRFGARLNGAIVQAQVPAGLELLIGAARDPAFGPFVVVGAGGVEAEVRADRAVLVAPVRPAEARAAIEGLNLAPLFHGFRGRPELPVEAVVDLVTRVGALAAAMPEMQQLDLNPVIVRPSGCVAVDALVALAPPPSPTTPTRAMRGRIGTRR